MDQYEQFEAVMDELPHGSGIDGTWQIVRHRGPIVVYGNGYHYMTEHGFYDGWIDFEVVYSVVDGVGKFRRLICHETEWLVKGECGNCGGIGPRFEDCEECDEEGLVEYDDLPQILEYLDQCFWENILVEV
jgi:hypothetical protein